ncbi:protein kinase domain-containing protein [Streptomyces tirandamycinicus]|uniref:Serine/threonine protein kinase n=1 Tax=Streptomyces tirandamycinicus TaxID=2174846 RepID=A0A2S1SVI3_9ACTN|nr:serine/threonine-protein kinase [Streptomyces tirandamycinicus]AWI30287.1 serine/threonine protein kinase [Streptomyces tirandamycinicus]
MPPLRSTGPVPEAEHPEYAGQYRLERRLGSGGMGVVHLAASASGLRLAVKVVHPQHATDPEFRARFRQEVAAARRVSGAFTAPVVDADPEAGRPWMATLFIEGPTLSERVKRNGPLGLDELRRVGAGLAEALRDIHRAGVVHRDLKPGNVMLAADGPKVIDFGISRPSDSDLRTETGKLIGTPPFMAPEQFQRPRDVGPAADLFALGAVLVHAATGRGPFDSGSPYVVAYQVVHNEPDLTGVPAELVPLLTRCLAKDPAERPAPDEVMAELRTPVGEVATESLRPGRAARRAPGEWSAGEGPGPARAEGPDRAPAGTPGRASGRAPGRAPAGTPDQASGRAPGGAPGRVSWPRRRLVRFAAVGSLVAGLLAGAYAGIRVAPDGGARPAGPPAARPGAPAFAPWQTTLSRGRDALRTPACAAQGDSLYCTAPGVAATRLDAADGRPLWTRRTDGAGAGAGAEAEAQAAAEAQAQAEGGTSYEARAPVLSAGLLHITTAGGKRLEALDPESGTTRWTAAAGSYATVAHAGGCVLLAGADGDVRALDGATGEELWRARRGAPGTQWAPAPDGSGTVFAVTPGADGDGTLVRAVGTRDGRVRWEKLLDGSLSPVPSSPPAEGALFLLAADTDDFTTAVVRLDTATREVHRVPLPVDVDQAQAAVSGGTVYLVGTGGSLLAVGTEGGSGGGGQRWRLETYAARSSRPLVDGGRVYLSGADGRLLAVDARRGVQLGQTDPRMGAGRFTHAPVVPAPVAAPGRVFATAPDGSVFAVDAADPSRW